MTVSTAFFNASSLNSLSRLDRDIGALQERVATGKNDPLPSSDLMRASQLSALDEVGARLDRYDSNLGRVSERLSATDSALDQITSVTTRLKELAIQASTDTTSEGGLHAIRAEALQLKESLLGLANTRDSTGSNLFGGFKVKGAAFEAGPDGKISYIGDQGAHALRVSETVDQRTGIDGASAFMQIDTENGQKSIFEIADDFIASLDPAIAKGARTFSTNTSSQLDIQALRDPVNFAFELSGPMGSTRISADMTDGAPGALIDAVNSNSGQTGVTARLADDNRSVVFEVADGQPLKIGGLEVSDPETGAAIFDDRLSFSVRELGTSNPPVPLSDDRLKPGKVLGDLDSVVNHVIDKRADMGALAAAADKQVDIIADRKLNLEKSVSSLEDADIAQTITELQSLLVNRQAAQATFAKITQQSLFDYLR